MHIWPGRTSLLCPRTPQQVPRPTHTPPPPTAASEVPQISPPTPKQKLLFCTPLRESRANQGNPSCGSLQRTNAAGQAGAAAALAEIPNPARPAAPSNSSCPPDCPHGSYSCCWENVKQLLGYTNTIQRLKTALLPINIFQVFKCSKKTRSGPFACWR